MWKMKCLMLLRLCFSNQCSFGDFTEIDGWSIRYGFISIKERDVREVLRLVSSSTCWRSPGVTNLLAYLYNRQPYVRICEISQDRLL